VKRSHTKNENPARGMEKWWY